MKAIGPVLGLFAAILVAAVAPATASAAPVMEHSAQADLNGDGTLDRVVVRAVAGNPEEQLLIATVGRTNYVAREEFYAFEAGVQPPRVVDLNDDGRDEVILTESLGNNTDTLSVWGLNDGWRPVKLPDQSRLRLYEGGGASAINRYGCEIVNGQRKLVTVSAFIDWETEIYSGERIVYTVGRGAAEPWLISTVTGAYGSAVFYTNPQACV